MKERTGIVGFDFEKLIIRKPPNAQSNGQSNGQSIDQSTDNKTEVDIQSITGIQRDKCTSHYENEILPGLPCNTKLKLTHMANNISRHNTGEICLGGCLMHHTRRTAILYNLLRFIIKFLGMHKVQWSLYYGGLVGLYTRKELLPWDPDLDIIINIDHIDKLPENYENGQYKFHISKDITPTTEIIGRFVDKKTGLYSDITYFIIKNDEVLVKKKPMKIHPSNYLYIPTNKFFPLLFRQFSNGIVVPTPSDILFNIDRRYKKIEEHYYESDDGTYLLRPQ
jgi:hypothetical protein